MKRSRAAYVARRHRLVRHLQRAHGSRMEYGSWTMQAVREWHEHLHSGRGEHKFVEETERDGNRAH